MNLQHLIYKESATDITLNVKEIAIALDEPGEKESSKC